MTGRVVIIGGGMAGRRLAELLPTYDVTVLGDEPSYNRSRLTEYVAGRAEVALGNEVVATAMGVDRVRRVVTDAEGREHSYDHLVFATGARPVGREGYVLRSFEDARAV
ncbi:MAG TPA: FAD-dependent oxidoreductase, partial [Kribbella sp.]